MGRYFVVCLGLSLAAALSWFYAVFFSLPILCGDGSRCGGDSYGVPVLFLAGFCIIACAWTASQVSDSIFRTRSRMAFWILIVGEPFLGGMLSGVIENSWRPGPVTIMLREMCRYLSFGISSFKDNTGAYLVVYSIAFWILGFMGFVFGNTASPMLRDDADG